MAFKLFEHERGSNDGPFHGFFLFEHNYYEDENGNLLKVPEGEWAKSGIFFGGSKFENGFALVGDGYLKQGMTPRDIQTPITNKYYIIDEKGQIVQRFALLGKSAPIKIGSSYIGADFETRQLISFDTSTGKKETLKTQQCEALKSLVASVEKTPERV